jgi:hypothetical protein
MTAAKTLGGMACCGRFGCTGVFGKFHPDGSVLFTSLRWRWDDDAAEWTHSEHSGSRTRRLKGYTSNERPLVAPNRRSQPAASAEGRLVKLALNLPTVMRCPKCGTGQQTVDAPRPTRP